MKSEKAETVKVQTNEQKAKTTKDDLKDELAAKRGQLKNDELKLNGGYFEAAQREVVSIDKEIKKAEIIIEMQQIQIAKDAPERPQYMFERDDRWRELNKIGMTEMVEGNQKALERLKKQKETMTKEIPELKARINELEKQLGEKITDFQKKKADYIG